MELTEKIKSKIKKQALDKPNEEICGFLLDNGKVFPCVNRASDRDVHFIIAAGDVKKAMKKGNIAAIYHSHIEKDYNGEDLDKFSDPDIVVSEYFNIKFVLYSISKDAFLEYTPTGKPVEYVGRPYIRGILDEFHLIQDYYKKELNIEINDVTNKNIQIFLKNNRFSLTDSPQKYDILIINWGGDVNDKKIAIYMGDDKLLIHPEFQLSKVTEYNYGLKKWTKEIYRHSKL